MSAPDDVLAVVDWQIRQAENRCETARTMKGADARRRELDELRAARAAIAELIEADKEYDAALSEFSHGPRPNLSPDSMDEWAEEWMKVAQRADLHDRLQSAKARRDAALAHVGGAS